MTSIEMATRAAKRVTSPGTMVKYLNDKGQLLVGIVVARKDPPTRGAMPIHWVVWSDGHMSAHVYCERL